MLERIEALPITPAAKAQLTAMFKTAANPNSERADVVLKTLEPERQHNAERAMHLLGTTLRGISQRAGIELLRMRDEDWERLLEDTNGSQ